MSELSEDERAELWREEQRRIAAKRRDIARMMQSDPAAIAELYTDWRAVIEYLETRNDQFH